MGGIFLVPLMAAFVVTLIPTPSRRCTWLGRLYERYFFTMEMIRSLDDVPYMGERKRFNFRVDSSHLFLVLGAFDVRGRAAVERWKKSRYCTSRLASASRASCCCRAKGDCLELVHGVNK
ncbi:unnamed protein product [Hapterophycus canaliculatus]